MDAHAQEDANVDQLERRVQQLESDVERLISESRSIEQTQRRLLQDSRDVGIVVVLFGAFCALWAQNTGRNPWLWFFLGLFFNAITVFVLLWKNADDHRDHR